MKPTYEELERKIAVFDLQLNLSLAAERAWETTMMLACGEDGPKSVADKFAAIEAKCAALAAENCQMLRLLTDISENHDEYVNQDDYLYAGIQMDYVSEINAYVSRDVEAENPFKETDAFLAEVRAISLEDFADVMADSGHYDAANYATKQAHKIRQEAAQ